MTRLEQVGDGLLGERFVCGCRFTVKCWADDCSLPPALVAEEADQTA